MHCPRCKTPLYEETLDGKRRARGASPYRSAAVELKDLASQIWIDRCPGSEFSR
jgi:hypothetical protein